MKKLLSVAIAAMVAIAATTVYAQATSRGAFSFSLSPSTATAVAPIMSLGSLVGGKPFTATYGGALTAEDQLTETATITLTLSGNLSDFSAFSVVLQNSGGHYGTLTIASPSININFNSPNSVSYDLAISCTPLDGLTVASGSVYLTATLT